MNLPAAKYIRIFSDMHLDFDVPKKKFQFSDLWMPEQMETDKDSVLVLAGDIWHADKPFSYYGESWMKLVSERFQYVLVVLGNHDFWSGNFPGEYQSFEKKIEVQHLDNVILLQDKTVVIGNTKFVGGTLWTDYMKGYGLCMQTAETSGMKDYKYIRFGADFHRLKPQHLLGAHIRTRDYILTHAVKDNPEQKVWVISHHLPSFKSIDEQYHDPMYRFDNALYYSDMDEEITKSEIDYWVHGHSHKVQDYMIGQTRILANPRGYRMEDTAYNPWFIMDL